MSELKKVAHVSIDRRGFLKAGAWSIGGIGLMSLLDACGAGSSSPATGGGGTTAVLNMPFLEDMQVPDPDIMYEGEGVQVMHAVYDGLAQYKPGTNEPVPLLAESWEISKDQLTYTFKLRPNVKFHDGTIADAASWVAAFKRRAAINQGPAYMVAGIKEAVATDATTLVVHLKSPNNAFLHYLACPWHPFAVSPTAVKKHAAGGDLAQKWLQTHDAGTGAYTIKEFVPGNYYLLEKFPGYWGGDVAYDQIRITITPSVSTQELQLQQGQFDLITKGLPIPDVLKYQQNPDYEVPVTLGGTGNAIWINPNRPMFADKKLRQALVQAIDRTPIVQTSYGGLVPVQKGFWIDKLFPAEPGPHPRHLRHRAVAGARGEPAGQERRPGVGGRRRRSGAADGRARADAACRRGPQRHGAPAPHRAGFRPGQPAAGQAPRPVRRLARRRRAAPGHGPADHAAHRRQAAQPVQLLLSRAGQADGRGDPAADDGEDERPSMSRRRISSWTRRSSSRSASQPFPIIARNYLTGIVQDSDLPEVIYADKIGRKLS